MLEILIIETLEMQGLITKKEMEKAIKILKKDELDNDEKVYN